MPSKKKRESIVGRIDFAGRAVEKRLRISTIISSLLLILLVTVFLLFTPLARITKPFFFPP